MARKVKAPHHRGGYQVQAKRVTDMAKADPTTRCWRCGLTLTEVRRAKPRARWTAGHLVDGQAGGRLAPECSPCNFGAGARLTNTQRAKPKRTPLTW